MTRIPYFVRKYPESIPAYYTRNLWCTKWHWERFLSYCKYGYLNKNKQLFYDPLNDVRAITYVRRGKGKGLPRTGHEVPEGE